MADDVKKLPFFRPHLAGREREYVLQALENRAIGGDGAFTKQAQVLIRQALGGGDALLTHSCTAALEMAALLLDLEPGDEVILPSYTFVSTANAFVLRGARPVFVDIRPDTLNIDENLIEAAITPRTRAIVVVHYAGVACEMDTILAIAQHHGLPVVEDAAQAFPSSYRGIPCGRFGALSAFSFHETKNIVSGEGGALVVNDPTLVSRAEILREKGTDRSRFFRGFVDKYTWQDVGSSFLPSDLVAAVLCAQLEAAEAITQARLAIWDAYRDSLNEYQDSLPLTLPSIPAHCRHNGHIFHFLLDQAEQRPGLLAHLKQQGVGASFHYVPLHSSPAGRRFSGGETVLPVTDRVAETIVRLPLFVGMEKTDVIRVVEAVADYFRSQGH
jgi:dTDP-4-amino-4,6-dideoxygalactose transaminase